MDIERQMEINSDRRERANDRAIHRLDRLVSKAEALVGNLCRLGRTVYYVNLTNRNGDLTGRIAEFGNQFEAIDYLIRNRYVA